MVNNKKRETFLAIVTGILILSVTVFSMILEPQVTKRKKLLRELREKQTTYTKMSGEILLKTRVDEDYARTESLLQSTGTRQEEMSAFSQEFQSLNAKFNLEPRTIDFMPMIKNDFYRKILVKVELNGGIKNILDFISNVENEKKTMKFEKVRFIAKDRDDHIQFKFVLSKVISNEKDTEKTKFKDV